MSTSRFDDSDPERFEPERFEPERFDHDRFDRGQLARGYPGYPQSSTGDPVPGRGDHPDPPTRTAESSERLWLSTRILVAIAVVVGVLAIASAVGAFTFGGHGDKVGEAAITVGPDEPVPAEPAAPSTSGSPVPSQEPSAALGSAGPVPSATTDPVTAAEAEVLTLVNGERARAGCRPVALDTRLATAAGRHSADMARRGYFSHTTPEGVTFGMRITNAGYRWSFVGENIAFGQRGPAAVMRAWMTSPGHRANILNCRFRHLGVGLAYDARRVPYWTQDFGTPLG